MIKKFLEMIRPQPQEMTGFARIGDLKIPMEQFVSMNAKQLALVYLQQAQLAGITLAEEITFDADGNLQIVDEEGSITHNINTSPTD